MAAHWPVCKRSGKSILPLWARPANLNMTLTYRLDEKPNAPVLWTMSCGDNCSGKLDVTNSLTDGGEGSWQELSVPLRCFIDAGLDETAVNAPMILESNGTMVLSLSRIEVTQGSRECPR